jgi:hypothetical protein
MANVPKNAVRFTQLGCELFLMKRIPRKKAGPPKMSRKVEERDEHNTRANEQ